MTNIVSDLMKIKPGDMHALDGIVENPVAEALLFRDVRVWDALADFPQ